ncbi:flagellar motor switch protein FliN [Pirellulales bacterium]|nr:flagellar motor switch protein FliN [Pirellulales bacterium]
MADDADPVADKPQSDAAPDADDGGAMGQDDIEMLLNSAGQDADDGAAMGQDDIEMLLNKAEQALESIDQPESEVLPDAQNFEFEDFTGTQVGAESVTLELMRDVQLDLTIELGRTHMKLEEVLKLKKGAVVPLDKLAGDPADIYANGRLVARGEVLVLNDNFCVRVAELVEGDAVE